MYNIGKNGTSCNQKTAIMDYREQLENQLAQLAAENLRRRCVPIDSPQGPVIRMADGSEKILFCSNNYLGLANHPQIRRAVIAAIEQYGTGAAASRLICGTMTPHVQLETAFARFLRKEAALYLPSGWAANQALLTTLPQKGDLVLMDRFDHASIIDAVKASEADFRTYRRPGNEIKARQACPERSRMGKSPDETSKEQERLEKFLSDPAYNNRFIVTESIFSMDGDAADLPRLVELKKKYNAVLIVDEAHALGCFGTTGAGFCEQAGVLDDVDIIVAPLGKAVASSGGIIAGPRPVIDILINRARPFIYTTAPSPMVAAAALEALRLIQTEPVRRQQLQENAAFLRHQFRQMGLDIGDSAGQIIPVILGDAAAALRVSQALLEAGLLVSAIRPPTVPPNTARLRIAAQADHTPQHLKTLCRALKQAIPHAG
jgi:7-keto-8-aminopelargonate synthetase-like enzyme